MDYEIRYVKGHVEVFDKVTGEFIISADTVQEAELEMKEVQR